jgi:SAM-dependent methyltransferase
MNGTIKDYYDGGYLAWQREIGEFGGWADSILFRDYIKETDVLLDFGCGVGALLDGLSAARKVGVEINPKAAARVLERGLEHQFTLAAVADNSVDVVISNHALEHCENPFLELTEILRVLRSGGSLVLVVPCETVRLVYDPNDVNQHLFTWAPANLGNLVRKAGFSLIECCAVPYVWPPRIFRTVSKVGGRPLFTLAARAYGWLAYLNMPGTRFCQVRAVAVKP